MCICTMVYLIVLHFSELFTYPNKMFVAFDQWGLDNRGFTVYKEEFKMVVCKSLMCPLLNCHQISQAPGASTVEYPRGNNVCK